MGGKGPRLRFLCDQLMLNTRAVNNIHYQLLHRTASAVIQAKKFNATVSLMLVHAFEKTKEKYDESFEAYCRFISLFDTQGKENTITPLKTLESVDLFAGWIKGNKRYLNK
jgi:hypothetical protein